MNIFKVLPNGKFAKIMNNDNVSRIVLAGVEHDEVNQILKLIHNGKLVTLIKGTEDGPVFDIQVPPKAHFNWDNGAQVQLMLDMAIAHLMESFDSLLGDAANKLEPDDFKIKIWTDTPDSSLYESEIIEGLEAITSGSLADSLMDQIKDLDDDYQEKSDSSGTRSVNTGHGPKVIDMTDSPIEEAPACSGPGCAEQERSPSSVDIERSR
jgi:hypothetical protein